MIFKTITSDIDKTRQSLLLFNKDWNTWKTNWNAATGVRGKIGSLFASTAISQSDVQAIQAYNAQIDACVTSQTAFNRTMLNASPAAQNLVASCNGAKVSMQQLETATQQVTLATKASHAAMKVFSVALNMIAYTAIIKGIQILSESLYDLANAEKVASENADELYNESSSKVQQNEEETKSLEELIQRYKELKENEHLDLEGRQEVKELQNDIADLVGIQAKNLDLVNGKLDDEIKKLNEISKKEAKQAFQDAEVNYYNAKDAANKAIGDDKVFFTDYDYAGDIEVDARNALKEAGFGVYNSNGNLTSPYMGGFGQDGVMGGQMVVKAIGDTAQEKYDYLQSMIEVLEQYGLRDSKIAIGLKEQAGKYEDYITNQQNAANSLVDSWITYSQFSNEELSKINVDSVESFETYRQKMIDEAKKDESIGKVLADGTLSNEDLENAINDFMATSLNFSAWYEQWINNVQGSTLDNEITVLSFKDALSSEGYEDISKELKTLAEAGELTPNTLTSTKEYNALLKDTNTSAQEATEQLYNMIDANERLATFSSNMGNVDKAYAEFKTNGFNTMDTLSGMQSAFGDLDYYNKFIKIAGDAKSSTEQIQEAYNKLVTEYVYSIGILDTVNESNKGLIQTQLEQLGITNAEEIVTKALNNEIMSLSEAKAILAQYSLNLESVTSGEINKLVTEGKVSNNTAQQIALFALKKKLANGTTITTDGDIKNLIALAGVSSKVIQMMYTLDTMKKKIASGLGEAGTAGGKAYLESKAKALEADIKKELNKGNSVNFNVDYSGGTATTDAVDKANKEATKSTTKFSQAIDWCAQTLSKLSKTIDLYSAKLDRNTNSVKTQIKYYKELLNAQNNIVKGYAKTESKYKSTYTKALKKLSKSDQKKVKDGTYTIEQFSGTTKKSGKKSKAEKRYNNIQKALEARDNYLDAQTDSVNAKNQLQEYAEDLASVRWDKATEQVEKLNNQISVLDTRMSNVSGYKAKNKVLQEQLDLQKNILTKQENAYENTQSDANAYYKKISSKYKKNKNADGTIKTKGVTNQTQLKYIKIYNAYVKKLAEETIELEQAQEDYTAAVQEAKIAQAENIKADYDNKLSLIEAKANELNSEIALAEAKGQVASVEYYKLLGDNSNQRLSELENEKKLLKKQLSSTRAYSDEWYEVKQAVIEVDEEIANETVNAVENINKQIEAMKELTQAKNDYLSGTVGTLDWLEGLIDEDDYYNEDGGFSDKGLAVAKGKLTKSGLYEQQAKNIKGDIDALDEKYKDNQDDANYLKQRMELTQDYQDAMTSWYDEQKSLHDMYINSLKKESEALQDLIDKKKESWEADKSEYDYQKSISEKTKNITDLEKRKAMLAGSTNEEEKAELQKINVELEEAQQDLEDTQYEKQLERMEDALDGLQERFDAIIEKLDKEGVVPSVEEIATIVSDNEKNVETGIKQIIDDAGLSSLLGEKGFEGLNKTANELLTTPVSSITSVIGTTNDWLGQIFEAVSEDTSEDEISLAEALGTYDSKNKTADTSGKSALNKYLMSQGYEAMDTQQMVTLKDAILNSKYSAGMDESLKETLTGITSANNLTKGKDNNYSDNKNAIMNALKYTKANEFISKNATKATKKKSEYGILNKKIYDITGGKVLSKADTLKLGSIFNVKDTDKSGGVNADEAKKLVKLLENAGFANGGIVEAVHKSGDDGIAKLKVGEAVLTPVQTDAFLKLADNFTPLNNFMDIIQKPKLPTVQSGVGATNTIESINVELNLPNVTDKESFMKMVKSESDVQRMLQNIGFGGVMGSNKKFNVYKL